MSFAGGDVSYSKNKVEKTFHQAGRTPDISLQEELKYTKGFLASVEKKLSNERFVAGAPEKVLSMERQKQTDAQAKIKLLEEKLASLN